MTIRRILDRVAPGLIWRWDCPRTAQAVAEHYIQNHLNDAAAQYIRALPSPDIEDWGVALAHKRRISAIYGVSTCYDDPRGPRGRPGWNRKLLADCRSEDAESAVEEIYKHVWERLREGSEREIGPGLDPGGIPNRE